MPQRELTQSNRVTFVYSKTDERTIVEVAANEYILGAAREQNINIPSACNASTRVVCTGKLLAGQVDRDDRCFLKETELKTGFVLVYRAYPTSNCIILTHQEDELLSNC